MFFSRRQRACGLLLATLLLCVLAWSRRGRAEQVTETIPIVFHIADPKLYAIEPASFVTRQLAHANETFAPLSIVFRDAGRLPLAAHAVALQTRQDRDALLALAQPGAVHCVIVNKLMDVDEPGRERRGVHWHPADKDRPHLVIVSTLSQDYVLAHELAHYFGNPAHSPIAGNVLSYTPGVVPPFFTNEQRVRVKRALTRLHRDHEL